MINGTVKGSNSGVYVNTYGKVQGSNNGIYIDGTVNGSNSGIFVNATVGDAVNSNYGIY